MRLHILGTAAARPWPDAHASSALLLRGGTAVLLDCGEGTLVRLPAKLLSQRGLDVVCVTHLHGDHVYGLPGLLTSMTLAGRKRALTLLGPVGLHDFLTQVLASTHARLGFEIHYPTLSNSPVGAPAWTNRDLEIAAVPLRHRVPAFGFCVSTTDAGRKLRPGVVDDYGLPYAVIPSLRAGDDYVASDGNAYANELLTLPPPPRRSLAYLTDTAPLANWPATLPTPTVMVHDATFASHDTALATETGHSTPTQAAAFAAAAGAGRLLLTHVSVRYSPAERVEMARRAAEVFPAARWAIEGEVVAFG